MFTFPVSNFGGSASQRSYIKSVQYITITMGSGSPSNTGTITTVNTASTAIILNGFTTTGTSIDFKAVYPMITLTNSTTVSATRFSGDTTTVVVYVCVIEFQPAAITSIQYGTKAWISSDTSITATISSVATARSALFWCGFTTTGTGVTNANIWRMRIESATTLRFNKNTAGNSGNIGYCVVEFASGVTQSIQQVSVSSVSASANTNSTISSVTTGNCLCIWNGMTHASGAGPIWQNITHYGFLQSSTNFRFVRYGTSDTASRTMNAVVIEFASGKVKSREAGQSAIVSGSTTTNATITVVNNNYAITSMCGFSNNATGSINSNKVFPGNFLQSTTNVRSLRNDGTTNESTAAWEVVELN